MRTSRRLKHDSQDRTHRDAADDLVRLDRARKGKKLSNADWVSRTDPDAK